MKKPKKQSQENEIMEIWCANKWETRLKVFFSFYKIKGNYKEKKRKEKNIVVESCD